jgi:hypothetical protein
MTTPNAEQLPPAAQEFIHGLIENAARLRLPELFAGERSGTLYRIPNRNGVSVIALRTTGLAEAELADLMRYRLAQYLAVNFVDRQKIWETRLEHEPGPAGNERVAAGRRIAPAPVWPRRGRSHLHRPLGPPGQSREDQDRVRKATFLVAGCGSVGGAVIEPLIRFGAEHLFCLAWRAS